MCLVLAISSFGQAVTPPGESGNKPQGIVFERDCLLRFFGIISFILESYSSGNPFRFLAALNSLRVLLTESPFLFLGFLVALGSSSLPLTSNAAVIGSAQVDRDFDGTVDSSHNILAENQNSAFIDFNDNSTFNQNTDVHLTYESSDDTFNVSNLTTTPSPGGQFSVNFLAPIFTVQEGTGPLDSNISMEIFSDIPEFQQLQLNKLVLLGTVILPHVPFGVAGALQVATQIVVNNPFLGPVEATMEFFSSANGAAANVNFGGTTASRHVVTIPARSSRLFETAADGSLQLNWGYLNANQPLGVSSNFLTRETGNAAVSSSALTPKTSSEGAILAEAGIAASGVDTVHVLNINRDNAGVGTSIALCNPTNKNAKITLTLSRATVAISAPLASPTVSLGSSFHFSTPQGIDEDQVIATATTTVNSKTQVAKFFQEFFAAGAVPAGPIASSLIVHSDTDVAVTSLKTINGVQSSSLPAGSVNGQ